MALSTRILTLLWRLILALMNATIAPTAPLAWFAAVLTLLAFIAYLVTTTVAVWRSAGSDAKGMSHSGIT